jgi:ribosomal protein L40E
MEGVRGKPFRVPPLSDTRLARQTHWPVPIPLAYQLWLAHLLWLEEVLHTLDCRPGDVTAAELAGLQALSRARARFLQEHQFCSRCQAANPRFAQRCRRCAQEF